MAYFECTTGIGAGGGATITVTYNSSFYNKTMTCSNGTKTYTKTTTSSGSTSFNVSDEGTWTITCNGVSRTVLVTLNYSTQMAVTKTITVYGAAGATISFTDAVGAKTVTLNNSGQGSVSITFIPPSQTITFTDTNVAKNPNNLSQNYSKSIAITESTSYISVMPDGSLYWYGWKSSDLQVINADNGWSEAAGRPFVAPTFNTNSIRLSAASGSTMVGVGSKNTISSGTQKVIMTGVTLSSYYQTYGGYGNTSAKTSFNSSSNMNYQGVNSPAKALYTKAFSGNKYLFVVAFDLMVCDVSALWYE